MMTSTTIYAVRHGESTWNREKRWQGRAIPLPLTEVGVEQAEVAGQFLKDRNIQVIVSSPTVRTQQTARIIASIEEVIVVDDLAERDIGPYSGMVFTYAFFFFFSQSLLFPNSIILRTTAMWIGKEVKIKRGMWHK